MDHICERFLPRVHGRVLPVHCPVIVHEAVAGWEKTFVTMMPSLGNWSLLAPFHLEENIAIVREFIEEVFAHRCASEPGSRVILGLK